MRFFTKVPTNLEKLNLSSLEKFTDDTANVVGTCYLRGIVQVASSLLSKQSGIPSQTDEGSLQLPLSHLKVLGGHSVSTEKNK